MRSYMLCLFASCSIALFTPPLLAADVPEDSTVQAAIDEDGTQRVAIVGGSSFFKPKHIIVKANVPVEFSIKREPGIVPHTFVLKMPESGVMIDVSLETSPKTVAFTATVPGKYTFYCRNKLLFFKSHREKGMEGVLEVVP